MDFSNPQWISNLINGWPILVFIFGIIAAFIAWLHSIYIKAKKIDATAGLIEKIHYELRPNSGHSLRDCVDRIEKRFNSLEFSIHVYWDYCEVPIFIADGEGRCVWANKAYCHLMNRQLMEVLGTGWEAIIWQDDREAVRDEWYDACQEQRIFDMKYRVDTLSEAPVRIHCKAYGSNKTGYVGFITLLKIQDAPPTITGDSLQTSY